jgi:hypothetical protein
MPAAGTGSAGPLGSVRSSRTPSRRVHGPPHRPVPGAHLTSTTGRSPSRTTARRAAAGRNAAAASSSPTLPEASRSAAASRRTASSATRSRAQWRIDRFVRRAMITGDRRDVPGRINDADADGGSRRHLVIQDGFDVPRAGAWGCPSTSAEPARQAGRS